MTYVFPGGVRVEVKLQKSKGMYILQILVRETAGCKLPDRGM